MGCRRALSTIGSPSDRFKGGLSGVAIWVGAVSPRRPRRPHQGELPRGFSLPQIQQRPKGASQVCFLDLRGAEVQRGAGRHEHVRRYGRRVIRTNSPARHPRGGTMRDPAHAAARAWTCAKDRLSEVVAHPLGYGDLRLWHGRCGHQRSRAWLATTSAGRDRGGGFPDPRRSLSASPSIQWEIRAEDPGWAYHAWPGIHA